MSLSSSLPSLTSVPFSQVTLITFDVDGTLVSCSKDPSITSTDEEEEGTAHERAFSYAVGRVLGNGHPVPTILSKALPTRMYRGSTDGLILLRLAKATLGIEPSQAASKLETLMSCMYQFINTLDDAEIARGIAPLPGVMDHLQTLATATTAITAPKQQVLCGLVTGNVEGIARRKMKALGIYQTGALSSPSLDQLERSWPGSDDIGFLGGFGSDFCSGNIDDESRNYLDRSEQLAIATRRAMTLLSSTDNDENRQLVRVVHVGDAPADVLAAKAFAERLVLRSNSQDGCYYPDSLCVGMVAVATGSYSAEELRALAGNPIPGQWEPVVLEDGMADPNFLKACGLY